MISSMNDTTEGLTDAMPDDTSDDAIPAEAAAHEGVPGPPSGSAEDRVRTAFARIAADDRPEVWINLVPEPVALAAAARVDRRVAAGEYLPLAGLTVGVKDNIDVAGLPTTAACPSFASGPATTSAPSVTDLEAAGAVVIGKTNLDQFATGLVGTRSPYGAVRNAVDPAYVAGGSSSGSAVAVARGHVDLALGTDTAGSGRVPAAHNGIVGLKPTRGLVSTRGVVPACASFDCVSVFAPNVDLAQRALAVLDHPDPDDPRARNRPVRVRRGDRPTPTVGIGRPADLDLAPAARARFDEVVARVEGLGSPVIEVDLADFFAAGQLLYGGAFVAERAAAVGAFLATDPPGLDPTVATIIRAGADLPAARYAADLDLLRELRRSIAGTFSEIDVLLLPTAPGVPTLADVAADPVGVNTRSGRFTTPCNLLDLAALAIPAGTGTAGLPFGVTLHAPAGHDRELIGWAARWRGEELTVTEVVGAPATIPLVVAGAHLSGQPLNHQLTELGGTLLEATTTAPAYRLYALDTEPPKPGLVRASTGRKIDVEVWSLPTPGFATFVAAVPSPLAIGQVVLADGSSLPGFTCMPDALDDALDITHHGGWRTYRASLADP